MTTAKTLSDAKARVREAEAALASHDASVQKDKDQADVMRKRLDRLAVPAVFARGKDPTTYVRMSMKDVEAATVYSEDRTKRTATAMAKEIVDGGRKVQLGGNFGGIGTLAGKSVAARLRVLSKADASALARLDKRIRDAEAAREALIEAGHARGHTLTVQEVAAHAAKVRAMVDAIPNRHGYGYGPNDWRRREFESELGDANLHLRFVTGQMDAEQTTCPCRPCTKARNEAEAARKEAARIAALPKAKVTACPCGKGHIVPIDRGRAVFDEDRDGIPAGAYQGVPVFTCPVSKVRYIHRTIFLAELAKEAKAKAKLLREQGVTWTCPTCEEDRTTIIEHNFHSEDGLEDQRYVSCDICETSFGLASIKIKKGRKHAA